MTGTEDLLVPVVAGVAAIALGGLLARYQRGHRTGLARPLGRPKRVELQWHGKVGDAFQRVSAALLSVNAQILDLDVPAGRIAAATKPSGNNSGFSIAVSIQALDQEVLVVTEAWSTVGLFDFGASRRFLEHYAHALSNQDRIEV